MQRRSVKKMYGLFLGTVSVAVLVAPISAFAANIFFQGSTFCQYAKNLFNFGVSVVGILAVIAVIIGGSMYMMSGGNPEKMTKAKEVILGAIIGVILVLASWLVFSTLAPNILVCKEPQLLGSAGGYNVPGAGTGSGTSGSFTDVCKGRTTYASKDACEKAKQSGEECAQGKDNKWCTTKCGDPQSTIAKAKELDGACVVGNHCAYFVGWALNSGSGCSKQISPSVSRGYHENDLVTNGFKKIAYNGDPNSIQAGDIVIRVSSSGTSQHSMLAVGGGKVIHSYTPSPGAACNLTRTGKGTTSDTYMSKNSKGKTFECENKLAAYPEWQNHGPGNYNDNVKSTFTKSAGTTKLQCIGTTGITAPAGGTLSVYRKQK